MLRHHMHVQVLQVHWQFLQNLSMEVLEFLLKIHLQVARVLVGDLINEGLIAVQTATEQSTERPDLLLLNRVLDGLQAL